jgi:hypothetical protein
MRRWIFVSDGKRFVAVCVNPDTKPRRRDPQFEIEGQTL